jgi:hypothetical protein
MPYFSFNSFINGKLDLVVALFLVRTAAYQNIKLSPGTNSAAFFFI